MKRRDFLSLTGATITAPLLPSMAVSAAAVPVMPTPSHVALATHLARYNPQLTAQNVMRAMKVRAELAHQIMGEITRNRMVASVGSASRTLSDGVDRMVDGLTDVASPEAEEECGHEEDDRALDERVHKVSGRQRPVAEVGGS